MCVSAPAGNAQVPGKSRSKAKTAARGSKRVGGQKGGTRAKMSNLKVGFPGSFLP